MEFVICIMVNANVIFHGKENPVKPKSLKNAHQIVGVTVFVKMIISVIVILGISKINQVHVLNVKMVGIYTIANIKKNKDIVIKLVMQNS